ncbi:MAG: pitrilysin family protein [Acidobacteriota bacterium]
MKRLDVLLVLVAVLALTLGGLVAPAAGADDAIFPYPVHLETLDNGLQLIVVPMPTSGLASYWSIVRTGSRDEIEDGRTGFAHFFEHMMFRGTESMPAEQYNERMTEMGANANAFTTDDLTAYHLSIAAEDLPQVMELEADRFQNLSYAEAAFQTEAGAVFGEYRKALANPLFVAYEALRAEMFKEHTYGHTTIGYVEDIQGMPTLYEYSKDFFQRFYRPDNTLLLIAGDVDPAEVIELANRHYGDWQAGYQEPEVPQESEQTAERRIEVTYDGATLPILWVSYKGFAYEPTERLQAATGVLLELAFGETSDLYQRLVIDEQLVESIGADAQQNRDPGPIDIITRVKDEEQLETVLAALDETIARYRKTPPTADEVDAVKSHMRYSFLLGLDTPARVAASLARLLAVTGQFASVETMFETLQGVTPEDVRQAAEAYLVPERRTIVVLKGAA